MSPSAEPRRRLDDDELSPEALRLRRARARNAAAARRRNTVLAGIGLVALVVIAVLALVRSGDDGDRIATDAPTPTVDPTVASEPDSDPGTTLPPLGSTSFPFDPSAVDVTTSTDGAATLPCSTADWPLDTRLRSLVFAALDGPSAADLQALVDAGVGGILVTSGAISVLEGGALRSIVDSAPVPPLVSVDEEGGTVQRLKNLIAVLPSAREMAAMTPDEVTALATTHGTAMRELGINADFAPVVDVTSSTRGVIGTRSFGGTTEVVVTYAGAFADGLSAAGIIPTFKHYPGHGRASGDSHDGLVTTPPLAEMEPDLAPFRHLLATRPRAMVMVGHLDVPGLTDGLPATVSAAAIDLLREDIGFDGVVVTDDLGQMQGIRDLFSTVDAAVASVVAGVDMPLVPATQMSEVVDALHEAVTSGDLTDEAVTRAADRVLTARRGEACG